jgi:hypothetical protein
MLSQWWQNYMPNDQDQKQAGPRSFATKVIEIGVHTAIQTNIDLKSLKKKSATNQLLPRLSSPPSTKSQRTGYESHMHVLESMEQEREQKGI